MKTHRRIISCIILMIMLISTLSIFSVSIASAAQGSSTITLAMLDSHGDGWNGNGIDVYINGVSSGRYTVSSGSSAMYTISYNPRNTYEFKWVEGSYSSECSFTIKLDGEVLLSATQAQCGTFSTNYSLLMIDSVQEEEQDETKYDLDGEFAGGTGTTADPYLVATKYQLNNVRKHSGSHFRQVRNIVFTSSDFGVSGDFYNDGKGWEPIGIDYNNIFIGSYDGNGCGIDGLTITTNASQTPYAGLFGYVSGDVVNVQVTNINYTVTGYARIGGIVGAFLSGEIIGCSAGGVIRAGDGVIGGITSNAYKVEHCESNVSIDVVGATTAEVGGIVGYTSGSIKYCKNSGNITVSGESDAYVCVGGIAGTAEGDIARCENNGTVSSNGYAQVGGIVGAKQSTTVKTISECVNRGNVSAVYPTYLSYVGGIIGEASGYMINNCYVTDTVTLTARGTSEAIAGGIAGYVWDESSITNCYSLVNSVTVNTGASGWGRGGIAGHNYGTISKSYYRYTYGVGYDKGITSASRISTLSSYESQSSYSGFDFTSVWKMGTGAYKYAVLRMEGGHTHSLSHNAATVTFESAGNLENWYCSGCQSYFRNSTGTRYVTTDMIESGPLPLEGECGTGVTWKLTPEGELTIFGSGKMDDYTDSTVVPWYEYREKVKHITVEQGVTSLGSNAFKGCVNLTKITLADSIETIGDNAFSGCSNITQLRIPKGVISVGDKAFSSITNLILCFECGAPQFGGLNVFSGTSATVYYPNYDTTWTDNVMEGLTGSITWTSYASIDDIIIASGSFYSSGDINWSFSLSGNLTVAAQYSSTKLPDYSFSSQRPAWDVYKEYITSVKLVNLSRIGNYTFSEYPQLKSVNFGTVKEVGSNAFYGCSALERVFLEELWVQYVTIDKYAFSNCSSLQQVAFPKNTTIADYAFSGCSKLDVIYITTYSDYGGTPVSTSTSSNSFYGVTATVYVPIHWSYFKDYGDFGGNLTWKEAACGPCGSDAFWTYDSNTSTITITGTGSIAHYSSGSKYPWYGLCSNVTKVVFEDGVTYIPEYVLEYMSEIQTVTLPNTLQKLACNAFNGCKNLNNLIIPASLTAFQEMCYFNRCDSLTDVYYMGTAQEWSNIDNKSVVGSSRNIHYLVLIEQPPTCTTAGTETYYQFDDISVYPGYYNLNKQPITHPDVVQALGHDYETKWTTDVDPTCTTVGSKSHHCSRCDGKTDISEIPANGHSYGGWYEIKAPTCTESGTAEHECLLCHYKELRTTDEKGHTNAAAVVENKVDATCIADGSYDSVVYCSVCKAELSREAKTIDELGHDYVTEWTEDVAPTCTTAGSKSHHCSRCDDKANVTVVPENGHKYGEWYETKAPESESKGEERRDCENCDHYETREIEALGYLQAFINAVETLSKNESAENIYIELYSALQLYSKLTDDEKQEVNEEFFVLQEAINAYNSKAETANTELKNATEIAFIPITVSFTFLAALWFLLKKKFWI